MTDRYLITVLEEAEYVAEQHHQVARAADNQVHEYLRYAVLRILERAGRPLTDGLDADRRRHCRLRHRRGDVRQLGLQRGLVGDCPTAGIVYPLPGVLPGRPSDRPTDHRRRDGRARCLASLGAGAQPRVAPTTIASAAKSTTCGRKAIRSRKCSTSGSVALRKPSLQTVVGLTGDVRDRLVVDDDPQPQDDLEPRTKRAIDEAMDVSLLSKGGRYEVQSASGNRYEVDVVDESCTCPDWQQRSPEGGCKHLRRVDHEIEAAFPDQTAAFPPRSRDRTTPQDGLCRHLDEPGRALVAHKWG